MSNNSKTILERIENKKVGVFCDDSNLYHSYKKYEWRIDFKKFRSFLKKHANLQFINYYVAVPDKSDASYKGTMNFLKSIEPYVNIEAKDLKYIQIGGRVIKKGDVDVEIVLDVVRNLDDLDMVIVVSGDSDYLELKNYVVDEQNENIAFWAFEDNMAYELKYCWHLYLNNYKEEIGLEA